MIDITITATVRPALLRQTLDSFENFFRTTKSKAIINVDPVGLDIDPRRVVDVCQEYFDDVIWRTPKRPNFSDAFKWCWSKVTSPLVFNLEDDWRLERPFDMDLVWFLFRKYRNLGGLRLSAFQANKENIKTWNHFIPWNEEFYEVPEEKRASLGFCGHPTFIRGEFVQKVSQHINVKINPEKQFHHDNQIITDEVNKYRWGLYGKATEKTIPPLVTDLGRQWMIKNGFRKEGSKAFFKVWRKAKEGEK